MSEPEGGGVFLSYRRQESSYAAGRLYDRLAERFGAERVFIDVDTIEPGVDFTEAIGRAVESCEVLLAIIGAQWLTATEEQGRRRLDDPDDIVRIEIEAALVRDVRVIPILIENAIMPRRQDLPDSLASLARRNAFTIRHESFRYDAERLVKSIEGIIGTGSREQPEQAPRPEQAAQPRPPSRGSVTEPKEWQLEAVAKQGSKTTFHLSSGSQSHEIVIDSGWKGTIRVDGELVAGGELFDSIDGNEYQANTLSAKVGSRVTIKVTTGSWATMRVKSLTVEIDDQTLNYDSGIK
jgi:hypothetical protein